MRGLPVEKAGVGSAVVNTSRQLGGSLGIALMGAIVAHEVGGQLSPDAFVYGLSVALVVAGVIALAGAVTAVALIRSHAVPHAPEEPDGSSSTVSTSGATGRSSDSTMFGREPARQPGSGD